MNLTEPEPSLERRRSPYRGVRRDCAPENRARAKEAGFDFYLVKPVDYANLEQLLQQSKLRAAERRVSHH